MYPKYSYVFIFVIIQIIVKVIDGGECPPGFTLYPGKRNSTSRCMLCDSCSLALMDYLNDIGQNLKYANNTLESNNLSEKLNLRLEEMKSTLFEHQIGLKKSQKSIDSAKASFKMPTEDIISLVEELEEETKELEDLIGESIDVGTSLDSTWGLFNQLTRSVIKEINHDKVANITLMAMLDMRQSIELLYRKVVDTKSLLEKSGFHDISVKQQIQGYNESGCNYQKKLEQSKYVENWSSKTEEDVLISKL